MAIQQELKAAGMPEFIGLVNAICARANELAGQGQFEPLGRWHFVFGPDNFIRIQILGRAKPKRLELKLCGSSNTFNGLNKGTVESSRTIHGLPGKDSLYIISNADQLADALYCVNTAWDNWNVRQ